jgi:homoserine dehydrogenase
MSAGTIGLGLLGFGNVAQGVVKLLRQNGDVIERKSGKRFEIVKALVRNTKKRRDVQGIELTTDPEAVLGDDRIAIVVELLGGLDPAYSLVTEALRRGKHVVTANKTLMAEHGEEILLLGEETQRYVGFEAAVCAGIPLIRSLMEGLVANRIEAFRGIVNGTTNYILTRMGEGMSYGEALQQAQRLGFAEPDPTADVSGADVAQKLAILASIAFSAKIMPEQIPCLGIDAIETDDEHAAREYGYTIKMLAHGARSGDNGSFDLRVHPTLVPLDHPLASVHDENNAVLLRGDAVGDILYYGKGAGAMPTASGVLSDVVDIGGSRGFFPSIRIRTENAHISTPELRHYLRFVIADKPGVIGRITSVLGEAGISLTHANAHLPKGSVQSGRVRILTHPVARDVLAGVLSEIASWPDVEGSPLALPLLVD